LRERYLGERRVWEKGGCRRKESLGETYEERWSGRKESRWKEGLRDKRVWEKGGSWRKEGPEERTVYEKGGSERNGQFADFDSESDCDRWT